MACNSRFSVRRLSLRTVLLCAAIAFSAPSVVHADPSAEQLLDVRDGVSGAVYKVLSSKVADRSMKDAKAVHAFYQARNFEPYWVDRRRMQSDARELLELIEGSWIHGLNPYSYHLKEIRSLQNTDGHTALADTELLLTDAYVRLGQDLTGIRVNPSFMKSHKRFWQAPLTGDALLSRLEQTRDVEDLVESYYPRGKTYRHIQDELKRLINSDPEAYESVLPIRIRGALHPMERDQSVPHVRLRLGVDGPQTDDPFLYDDKLAAAVIRFQRENGLKDDGILGGQTLGIMNSSRDQKIKQLIANLERLRWVEEEKPDKFVVVNVPSATLWAVEDGRVQFDMPVIVGRKKRPTNIFRTEIHGVRLNPDWTVPPTIKKDDILPKLREDPAYLTNKGMQLIAADAEGKKVTLDPAVVEWDSVTEEDLKRLTMVQTPGRSNPLGQIRVLMPNSYNIYLHDTNERHYFERANRAASSGCVRMKDPEKMANFILKERRHWRDDALATYIANPKTEDLYIQDPIPVYLLYYTVWVNDQGALVYGNDLYDFDKDLIKMLEDIDGIFIPVDNT